MLYAVTRMMDEIASIMDGHVYGAWLYGSTVLNDFQLGWSDIDFVVLVSKFISDGQAQQLLMLRQDMSKIDLLGNERPANHRPLYAGCLFFV